MNIFKKFSVLLISIIIFSFTCHATEYIIKPYNQFNPDIIGKFIRFKPQVLYLVLDNSPPDFLKRNNGINRMIATIDDAEGNNIHEKGSIKDDMVFEVISIFHSIERKPKPAKWSEKDWNEYLDWRKSNEWVGVEYVLKDENGILSTTGPGGLSYSYDVTNNRDLIIRSYSSKITNKIRGKLIKKIREKGITNKENINEILRKTIPILSAKNQIIVNKILGPCSEEIKTYCVNIHNGYDLIDCLNNNLKYENSTCKNFIIKATGK